MNTGSRVLEIKCAQNKMCIVHTIVCVQCINYRIITGNVLTSRKICTVEQPHSSLEKIYLAGTGIKVTIISYLVDLLTKLGLMFGKT